MGASDREIDENFNMYMEDVDFCLRAKHQGIQSYFLASPLAFHYVSASVKRKPFKIIDSYLPKRTKIGWQAEFKLPFSTVRHREGMNSWGFNLWRKLPRNGEAGRWAGSRPEIRTYHFAQAGTIEGIQIKNKSLNLEFTPYVIGDSNDSNTGGDAGGDIRYRFKPNWTAHLSLNTDFAETEVDDRRLNYSRFPMFFPEKRDFFLEDAEVFTVGQQVMPWSEPEIVPYFSRRIGLNNNSSIADIEYAFKLTGHEGKYHVGLLNTGVAQTATSPEANLTIARVKRDVLE